MSRTITRRTARCSGDKATVYTPMCGGITHVLWSAAHVCLLAAESSVMNTKHCESTDDWENCRDKPVCKDLTS